MKFSSKNFTVKYDPEKNKKKLFSYSQERKRNLRKGNQNMSLILQAGHQLKNAGSLYLSCTSGTAG